MPINGVFYDKITIRYMSEENKTELPYKRTVLDYDDICQMAPFFKGKPKLVKWLFKLLWFDKVNWMHNLYADTPGVAFAQNMLKELDTTINIDGEEVLDRLPEGAFVTVSNHPFGALDGVMLVKIVGERRPDFKVMVNMILNHIGALRPAFIAVDALASSDPKKKAVSMRGITEALRHVREGKPLGFFPAGAVSKFTWGLRIEDRAWQPNVMRLIKKMHVPVIPIYFHGHNSLWFNILGVIDWRLRTLRLPCEIFHRKSPTFRVSIGEPIMPEEQAKYESNEALAEFLKQKTYSMKKWNKQ